MWMIKIRSLKPFSQKVAEIYHLKTALFLRVSNRTIWRNFGKFIGKRSCDVIFGEFPALEEQELQTSEQQIWCFVPHLIAVILPDLCFWWWKRKLLNKFNRCLVTGGIVIFPPTKRQAASGFVRSLTNVHSRWCTPFRMVFCRRP